MSLSMNNTINTNLPTQSVSSNSVLKNVDPHSKDITKVNFADMVQQTKDAGQKEIVTKEEKQFFATMFPGDSEKIRNYTLYTQSGKKNSVGLGTIIDVKG